MAAPSPGNHGNPDRGWNDPPQFNYGSASQAQALPRRTMLNKRVAYPMSSQQHGESTTMTANILNPAEGPPRLGDVQLLPPASNTSTPTPIPMVIPTLIPSPEPGSQLSPGLLSHPGVAKPVKMTRESLDTLLARLGIANDDLLLGYVQSTLTLLREQCSQQLQGRAGEDVCRRFHVMEESWRGGNISEPVRVQLGQLVSAMKEGNLDLANSIHLSLMVDYTNEVNLWMVGIKRLIQELYSKKVNQLQQQGQGHPEGHCQQKTASTKVQGQQETVPPEVQGHTETAPSEVQGHTETAVQGHTETAPSEVQGQQDTASTEVQGQQETVATRSETQQEGEDHQEITSSESQGRKETVLAKGQGQDHPDGESSSETLTPELMQPKSDADND